MKRIIICLVLVFATGLASTGYALAIPSAGFRTVDNNIFDDWQICRTRAFNEDGFYQLSETSFRPVIAFESLGENTDLAYNLGKQFIPQYHDEIQRAEQVFYFVRDRVRYTPDIDQFEYDEFAQNADELATQIARNGVGYGDCEDSAVLLAVMYRGAGYRSAIALAPGHTAALVHLPDYKKATALLELNDEGGWVWAEATGENNPLGWIPKEFIDTKLAAYEISAEEVASVTPTAPKAVIPTTDGGSSFSPSPFFGVIGLLWLLSLFRRRRSS
jgi:hypothetical protein